MKNRTLVLYLIVTMFGWGSYIVVSASAMKVVAPAQLLLYRYLVACAVLFPFLRGRQKKHPEQRARIEKRDVPIFAAFGVVGYGVSPLMMLFAIRLAGSSISSLVNSMNPIFIALFAALILRERITLLKIAAILCSVAGTLVLTGASPDFDHLMGIVLALGSGIIWSVSTVTCKRTMRKYDPVMVTTWALAIAAGGLLLYVIGEWIFAKVPFTMNLESMISILIVGVLCTAVPHVSWNKALSMADAGTCGMAYPLMPVVSVLLGVICFQERLGLSFLLGGAVIIIGVLLGAISQRRLARAEHLAAPEASHV